MQSTPDNSNQNRFPLDFLHSLLFFTLDNSNLPLTRSNFCFPSDQFYTILLSKIRIMFQARETSKRTQWTAIQNIEFLSKR